MRKMSAMIITVLSLSGTIAQAKICETIEDLLTGCSYIDSVVNAAAPANGIGQNSFITIFGAGLTNTTRGWNAGDFSNGGTGLPTELDGVSVNINNKPAFIVYISPAQINMLSPADEALGPVQLEVRLNGELTGAATVKMVKYDPALFSWGNRRVVATHTDFTPVAVPGFFPGVASSPAAPNETIILWGTGFGQTDPPFPNGQLLNGLFQVKEPVTVEFSGLGRDDVVSATSVALGSPGLYQIAVTAPQFPVSGDVSVKAIIGGISTFANYLAVAGKGSGSCGQPGQPKC